MVLKNILCFGICMALAMPVFAQNTTEVMTREQQLAAFKEQRAKWRQANPEAVQDRAKQIEAFKEQRAKYRREHPEAAKDRAQAIEEFKSSRRNRENGRSEEQRAQRRLERQARTGQAAVAVAEPTAVVVETITPAPEAPVRADPPAPGLDEVPPGPVAAPAVETPPTEAAPAPAE